MDSLNPEQPLQGGDLSSRAVQAAERLYARMDALDRTMREDVRRDVEVLLDLARKSDSALSRIATAEERRTALAEQAEQRREAWLARLWASPAGQLLTIAFVVAIMQFLGLSWLAERVGPGLVQGATP